MAIVQQYPLKTPKNSDLLVGTSIPDPNTNDDPKTSSFSVSSIGSFLITQNNIITGGGTLNKIAMFTPDGTAVGNSNITQDVSGNVTIGNNLTVNGSVTLGDSSADITTINSTLVISDVVQDSNQTLGTNGQLLVSNAASELIWQDFATLVPNNITGSGTVEYIPKFTPDGTAIGNSIMFTKPNGTEIQVGISAGSSQTILGAAFITTGGLGADNVTATNINGGNTGNVILSGGVIIGNEATDILQITSTVSDYTGSSSASAGQILVSTANGQLVWTDNDLVLTSPGGTQYRIVVDDAGVLSTVAV